MKKKTLMLLSLLMVPTTVLADVYVPEYQRDGGVSLILTIVICAVIIALIVMIAKLFINKNKNKKQEPVTAFAGKPEEVEKQEEIKQEEKEVE